MKGRKAICTLLCLSMAISQGAVAEELRLGERFIRPAYTIQREKVKASEIYRLIRRTRAKAEADTPSEDANNPLLLQDELVENISESDATQTGIPQDILLRDVHEGNPFENTLPERKAEVAEDALPSYVEYKHVVADSAQTREDGTIIQKYEYVTQSDYYGFGAMLGELGWVRANLQQYTSGAKVTLAKDKKHFDVYYDVEDYSLEVIYPAGSVVVDEMSLLYREAEKLLENSQYREVVAILTNLGTYKNSGKMAWKYRYALLHDEQIAAGAFHSCVVQNDGYVKAVGLDSFGQCEVNEWRGVVAVSAGFAHTVALRVDGAVLATGKNDNKQCDVKYWSGIIQAEAGYNHTVGLHFDGTVVATGRTEEGQCRVGEWTDIVAVDAGRNFTVGLKSSGKVVATGSNIDGECDVSDWHNVIAVSAGGNHTVGLCADGTVVATGNNEYGQCDVKGWKDIVAISAGFYHTVGLKADGTVVATGQNDHGQCSVGDWADITSVVAGTYHTLALNKDGTVLVVGDNRLGQSDVNGLKNIGSEFALK